MATANLNITEVVASQTQKEVTINNALEALDSAITEILTVDMTGNVTLTSAQVRTHVFFKATPVGVGSKMTFPALKRLFVVYNAGGTALDVACGTTVVTLNAGLAGLYYTDGTTNGLYEVSSGGGGGGVNVAVFVGGLPGDSELVSQLVVAEDTSFSIGMPDSQAYAGTLATSNASFTLTKNGVSIGTVDFTASNAAGSFSVGSAVTFSAGDRLGVIAPTPQDSTLSDVSITLLGTRA